MWIQLHDFASPVQGGSFADALGQLCHDPRRRCARRFHFQNAPRRQAGVSFIAMLDVERGSAYQAFFLPPGIQIASTPDRGEEKNQTDQDAEQKSDDGALCSFD